MPRVIHFEVHADDPARAIRFYETLFGWQFTAWGGGEVEYWLIKTGEDGTPGINGGLVRRRGAIDGQAVIAYVCTVDVAELASTLAKAKQLGAVEAVPTRPIPGVGWLAYVKDTEGNVFGMMQADSKAR
ncbi:MAG TPA: VOC family protein [Burkholderiaceae bacterium]|nr:VOC family protein [Burkholderiaceae bacterium]